MWYEIIQNWLVVLLHLVAGFCLIHLLCSAIADRISDRSAWPTIDEDDRKTKDTGPK